MLSIQCCELPFAVELRLTILRASVLIRFNVCVISEISSLATDCVEVCGGRWCCAGQARETGGAPCTCQLPDHCDWGCQRASSSFCCLTCTGLSPLQLSGALAEKGRGKPSSQPSLACDVRLKVCGQAK